MLQSNIKSRVEKLVSELRDGAYRHAYVEGHAKDTIAFQLRRMRLGREWEQKEVAALLGNAKLQPMISRYENPDYGKYSVTTLLELAKAFDVALVVRFVPFSELVRWDIHKSSETLQPPSYCDDLVLSGMASETSMWRKESRTPYGNFVPLSAYTGTVTKELKAVSSTTTPMLISGTQGRAA